MFHSGKGSTYFSGVYIRTVKDPKVKLHMRKGGNKFFSASNLQQPFSGFYSLIMEKCNKDISTHTFNSVAVYVTKS